MGNPGTDSIISRQMYSHSSPGSYREASLVSSLSTNMHNSQVSDPALPANGHEPEMLSHSSLTVACLDYVQRSQSPNDYSRVRAQTNLHPATRYKSAGRMAIEEYAAESDSDISTVSSRNDSSTSNFHLKDLITHDRHEHASTANPQTGTMFSGSLSIQSKEFIGPFHADKLEIIQPFTEAASDMSGMSLRQRKRKQEEASWKMSQNMIIEGKRKNRGKRNSSLVQAIPDSRASRQTKITSGAEKSLAPPARKSASKNVIMQGGEQEPVLEKRKFIIRLLLKRPIPNAEDNSEEVSDENAEEDSEEDQKIWKKNRVSPLRHANAPIWSYFERSEDWGTIPTADIDKLYDPSCFEDTRMLPTPQSELLTPLDNHVSVWGAPGVEDNPFFDDQEKRVFLDNYLKYPKRFSVIAEHLPGRTFKDCRDYYYQMKAELNLKAKLKAFQEKEKLHQEELKKLPRPEETQRKRTATKKYQDEKFMPGSSKALQFIKAPKAPLFNNLLEGNVKLHPSYYDCDGELTDEDTNHKAPNVKLAAPNKRKISK